MTDAEGTVTSYYYAAADKLRGVIGYVIQDDGGLSLRTDYESDDLGRRTVKLGPVHPLADGTSTPNVRTCQWTYYRDRVREVWTMTGYNDGTSNHVLSAVHIRAANFYVPVADRPTTPVNMSTWRCDYTVDVDNGAGGGLPVPASPNDPFASSFGRSSWMSWAVGWYDTSEKLRQNWSYLLIPSTGFGAVDTNYGRKLLEYDALGRLYRTTCPGGIVDQTDFNAMNWPVAEWLGVGTNLTQTQKNTYDADGNLDSVTQYVDSTGSNDQVTTYGYDFRYLQTSSHTTVQKDGTGTWDLYTATTYDQIGRATSQKGYHTSDTVANWTAYRTTDWDVLNRAYRVKTYQVASNTNYLTSNTFYDSRGSVARQTPAGTQLFIAYEYDAVSRLTMVSKAYEPSDSSSSSSSSPAQWDPGKVTYAVVLEQTLTTYDNGGNVILTTAKRRYDDATGLSDLGNATTGPKARVSYVATYPDGIGRVQASADYGTNDNLAFSRPATVPPRSGLSTPQPEVATYLFDLLGRITFSKDPAGIGTGRTWDKLSRLTLVYENVPSGS
ncbi:MAG: repeat-associated core domain protein, partial [Akkermansiaceae bacterium]|nr:repeat-associated core domain protein [Akkermansiaceae bacterium]